MGGRGDRRPALSPLTLAETLAPTLAARPEQVVVAVGSAGPAHQISSVRHLTFAGDPTATLVGGRLVPRSAPAMVERLQLWRLANFAVERLPAADDVYLARVVAHCEPQGPAADGALARSAT